MTTASYEAMERTDDHAARAPVSRRGPIMRHNWQTLNPHEDPPMDFEVTYTEEQQRFRHEVRAWLDANVTPGLTRIPVSDDDSRRRYHELRALGRKLGARGWLYPRAPQAYGGGGLDVDHTIILEEEVDRVGLALPPYYDSGGKLGSATILVWGTEAQKQAFLPPIFRGEVRTWQLLTEPGAGSDLAGVTTAAIRDGDEYVINGQKIFVGSENQGWKAASTHLELEHGAGGRIGRIRVWDRLLRYCQETKRDGVPLSQNADTRDLLADIFMKTEVMRLFGLRNFWLTYAKRP